MSVRAIVRDGRIRVDVATELPDGTVLDLVVDVEGDEVSDESSAPQEGGDAIAPDGDSSGLADPPSHGRARRSLFDLAGKIEFFEGFDHKAMRATRGSD